MIGKSFSLNQPPTPHPQKKFLKTQTQKSHNVFNEKKILEMYNRAV